MYVNVFKRIIFAFKTSNTDFFLSTEQLKMQVQTQSDRETHDRAITGRGALPTQLIRCAQEVREGHVGIELIPQ